MRVVAAIIVLALLAGCLDQPRPGEADLPPGDSAPPVLKSKPQNVTSELPIVLVPEDVWQIRFPGLRSGTLGRFLIDFTSEATAIAIIGTGEGTYGYVLWPISSPMPGDTCFPVGATMYARTERYFTTVMDTTPLNGRYEAWVWQTGDLEDVWIQIQGRGDGSAVEVEPQVGAWQTPSETDRALGPIEKGQVGDDGQLVLVSLGASPPTSSDGDWRLHVAPIGQGQDCPALNESGQASSLDPASGPDAGPLFVMGDVASIEYDLVWQESPLGAVLPGEPGWQLTVLAFDYLR